MAADTARLFFGLELTDDARSALSGVKEALEKQPLRAKLHAPSLYHLTLCFLGSIPRSQIPPLCALLDAIPSAPFTLTLSDMGTFKNGTILWAGVKNHPLLFDYQAPLACTLREAGFPTEQGEYHPHITLARQVKSEIPPISVPPVCFDVRHATLFESTRIDGVLTYLPIYRSVFR